MLEKMSGFVLGEMFGLGLIGVTSQASTQMMASLRAGFCFPLNRSTTSFLYPLSNMVQVRKWGE
ncbi:MAG: hypothetical protein K8L99_01980 [Anaerolineae bacterium]|nr:hypothetical protein [Anaerolineae bacterium]